MKLDGFEIVLVSGVVLAFGALAMAGVHSTHTITRAKQLTSRELGTPMTYTEAMGTSQEFINGRMFERSISNKGSK
jgi:hypothetical protein